MQRVLRKRVPNALRDEAKHLIHYRALGPRPEHGEVGRVWPFHVVLASPGPLLAHSTVSVHGV